MLLLLALTRLLNITVSFNQSFYAQLCPAIYKPLTFTEITSIYRQKFFYLPWKWQSRCFVREGRKETNLQHNFCQWSYRYTPSSHVCHNNVRMLGCLHPSLPVSQSEDKSPDVRTEHNYNPVDNNQAWQKSQEQQPEPDENIDFLID